MPISVNVNGEWKEISSAGIRGPNGLNGAPYNSYTVLTTTGTYTAPVSGWYKITLIGGGGGGCAGEGGTYKSGGGGGEGGKKVFYASIIKDTTYSYVIGTGGAGGVTTRQAGYNGGATQITIGNTVYSVSGGMHGGAAEVEEGGTCSSTFQVYAGGLGGWDGIDPFTYGDSGGTGMAGGGDNANGAHGGGAGGGVGHETDLLSRHAKGFGGGGAGGGSGSSGWTEYIKAGNGYQGCIILEYFDPAKGGYYLNLRDSKIASTIIYPNGGTKESPAEITPDQRIEMDNPYPGYYVLCEPQVYYNNMWGEPRGCSIYNAAATRNQYLGVSAFHIMPDDKIVVQSAGTYILRYSSSSQLTPFGNTTDITVNSAPCRVIVTRLGKIDGSSGGETNVYNTREVLTESGTYTAPVDDWYKVTCIGGGGGGQNGFDSAMAGAGGGSGYITVDIVYLKKGQKYTAVVGAGGTAGKDGGATTFADLTAQGGKTPARHRTGSRIDGCSGGEGNAAGGPQSVGFLNNGTATWRQVASSGGGAYLGFGGGGGGGSWAYGDWESDSGTSSGNGKSSTTKNVAGAGGPGAIILEYYDPEKTA